MKLQNVLSDINIVRAYYFFFSGRGGFVFENLRNPTKMYNPNNLQTPQ